jgi:HEAT repeat protein
VELYVILSPLEHLFRRPEAPVRNAVVRALSKFLFKRSFITLRAGLADSDKGVAEESAKALEMLHFPHAYDPLARIYRESQSPRARVSALRALSKIDSIEAAELLVGVIENDGRDERAAVVDSLRRARGTKFIEVARAQYQRMNPPAQAAVRELLQARGVAIG